MKQHILLGIVLVLIVGSILYLDSITNRGTLTEEEQQEAEIKIEEVEQTVGASEDVVEVDADRIKEKEEKYDRAKELIGISGYLNTDAITIKENIGKKVILVDFWTYSCINCQRTLPYINAWNEKYKDDGLLIIGVHSPEFDFEKDYSNVERAIEKFSVKYPVVQDNDFKTWRAYGNRYWPRKYLIDIDGFIVYDHIGEGRYQETEDNIRRALNERKELLDEAELVRTYADPNVDDPLTFRIETPELYFGYRWASRESIGNSQGYVEDTLVSYSIPSGIYSDKFYLSGKWQNNKEYMELMSSGTVVLDYKAKNVNIVAGSSEPVEIKIYVDDKLTDTITVQEETLYNIVSGEDYSRHKLEIKASNGLRMYTFTFG